MNFSEKNAKRLYWKVNQVLYLIKNEQFFTSNLNHALYYICNSEVVFSYGQPSESSLIYKNFSFLNNLTMVFIKLFWHWFKKKFFKLYRITFILDIRRTLTLFRLTLHSVLFFLSTTMFKFWKVVSCFWSGANLLKKALWMRY